MTFAAHLGDVSLSHFNEMAARHVIGSVRLWHEWAPGAAEREAAIHAYLRGRGAPLDLCLFGLSTHQVVQHAPAAAARVRYFATLPQTGINAVPAAESGSTAFSVTAFRTAVMGVGAQLHALHEHGISHNCVTASTVHVVEAANTPTVLALTDFSTAACFDTSAAVFAQHTVSAVRAGPTASGLCTLKDGSSALNMSGTPPASGPGRDAAGIVAMIADVLRDHLTDFATELFAGSKQCSVRHRGDQSGIMVGTRGGDLNIVWTPDLIDALGRLSMLSIGEIRSSLAGLSCARVGSTPMRVSGGYHRVVELYWLVSRVASGVPRPIASVQTVLCHPYFWPQEHSIAFMMLLAQFMCSTLSLKRLVDEVTKLVPLSFVDSSVAPATKAEAEAASGQSGEEDLTAPLMLPGGRLAVGATLAAHRMRQLLLITQREEAAARSRSGFAACGEVTLGDAMMAQFQAAPESLAPPGNVSDVLAASAGQFLSSNPEIHASSSLRPSGPQLSHAHSAGCTRDLLDYSTAYVSTFDRTCGSTRTAGGAAGWVETTTDVVASLEAESQATFRLPLQPTARDQLLLYAAVIWHVMGAADHRRTLRGAPPVGPDAPRRASVFGTAFEFTDDFIHRRFPGLQVLWLERLTRHPGDAAKFLEFAETEITRAAGRLALRRRLAAARTQVLESVAAGYTNGAARALADSTARELTDLHAQTPQLFCGLEEVLLAAAPDRGAATAVAAWGLPNSLKSVFAEFGSHLVHHESM